MNKRAFAEEILGLICYSYMHDLRLHYVTDYSDVNRHYHIINGNEQNVYLRYITYLLTSTV